MRGNPLPSTCLTKMHQACVMQLWEWAPNASSPILFPHSHLVWQQNMLLGMPPRPSHWPRSLPMHRTATPGRPQMQLAERLQRLLRWCIKRQKPGSTGCSAITMMMREWHSRPSPSPLLDPVRWVGPIWMPASGSRQSCCSSSSAEAMMSSCPLASAARCIGEDQPSMTGQAKATVVLLWTVILQKARWA